MAALLRDIVLAAERGGFDNVLLPSGYGLGIDSVAFAGGVAPLLDRMRLLVAVRCGELVVPQLARQMATLDQMLGGRLTVNIISSDVPGQQLASVPRYQRTLETMQGLRTLLNGGPLDGLDPPGARTVSGRCPPCTSVVCPSRPARWPRGSGRRVPDVARRAARRV